MYWCLNCTIKLPESRKPEHILIHFLDCYEREKGRPELNVMFGRAGNLERLFNTITYLKTFHVQNQSDYTFELMNSIVCLCLLGDAEHTFLGQDNPKEPKENRFG